MTICQCDNGQIATSHLEILEPFSCVRVGGKGLVISFRHALRIIVVIIGVVRPGLFTEVTCILIEFFWVLVGQVIRGILKPLIIGLKIIDIVLEIVIFKSIVFGCIGSLESP